MKFTRDQKDLFDKLGVSMEERGVYGAIAMMLGDAYDDGAVAIRLYKDRETGKPVAVIGRYEEKDEGNGRIECGFTPFAILFNDRPDKQIEPYEENVQTIETPMLVAQNMVTGEVVKVEGLEMESDPTKLN